MSSDHDKSSGNVSPRESLGGAPFTRRDFLKVVGVGAAAVGAVGSLGGALGACGNSGGSSNGNSGRTIKVGLVSPLTGPLAAFGEADNYCVTRWKEAVKDGITTADGTSHPVEIIVRDSQSDSNRAATVAGDLMTNDGVDVMMVTSTSDTVVPVADQAEALGVPCMSSDSPWQPFYFGRGATPDKPFKWTYHAFWGIETNAGFQLDLWSKLKNNKVIGAMWPNDADGLALADPKTGQPAAWKPAGYKIIDGGRYQDGSEDFSTEISKFKAANAQIASGVMIPPDFVNYWKQVHQQGYRPIFGTMSKALLFPSELEAMGSIGEGLTAEVWWHPTFPYKSSLTGESAQQFADAWEAATNKQWTQPLMHYIVFEVVADALKRTDNVDSKDAIVAAIKATDLDTLAGHINFTVGGAANPVPNVATTPLAGGQWVKGTKYPFDLRIVSNGVAPQVTVQQDVTPLQWS
jgi:branched-chain amino acid transport system substrate-binding protein